jgi:hypothetical protein
MGWCGLNERRYQTKEMDRELEEIQMTTAMAMSTTISVPIFSSTILQTKQTNGQTTDHHLFYYYYYLIYLPTIV